MIPGPGLVSALAAGVVLLFQGAPSQDAAGPPRDVWGDELPAGALSRLGTCRFRHAGAVSAVAFSPDGAALASGGADGVVHLWEAKTGKKLRTWAPGDAKNTVSAVEFSPDGKTLAATAGPVIWVWSTSTGEERRRLEASGVAVGVAFSPDGAELACQTSDGTVLRWDIASGKESAKLEGQSPAGEPVVPCLTYAPDGAHLAVGGAQEVRLYACATGKEIRRFKGHQAPVTSLAFSHDGRLLATAGLDSLVRLWEAASGAEIHALPGPKFSSPTPRAVALTPTLLTACLALAPDGKTLAVGGGGSAPLGPSAGFFASDSPADREIHLWNLDSGREIGVLRTGQPSFTAFRFSPDGNSLAAASENSVQFWDVASRQELPGPAGPRSPVRSLTYTGDGTLLASEAQGEPFIRLWDVGTAKEHARLPMDFPTAIPSGLASSPDGKTLTRTVSPFLFWDLSTRQQLSIHSRTDPSDWRGGAFSFFPDGKSFVAASDGMGTPGKIRIREVQTGKHLRSVTGKEAAPSSLAVSPDGTLFAAGYWDGSVWVWDAGTGQKLWSGQLPADAATREHFSRFGANPSVLAQIVPQPRVWFRSDARMLWGVWGASMTVWTATTGKAVQEFEGGWGGANTLTLSPDGKTLAGWKDDGVHLWELAGGGEYLKIPTGLPIRIHFSGFEDGIGKFAFSPKGTTLAVVSDQTVLIWDLGHAGLAAEAAGQDGREKAWTALASRDAREARAAMESLVRAGDRSVEFLSRRWTAPAPLRSEELQDLAAALASDEISRRDAASSALKERATDGQLEGLLEGKHAQETVDRLREILALWNRPLPQGGAEFRFSRSIEVLERIGSAKAAEALDTLVATARLVRQQRDAREALSRLRGAARK